MDFQVKPEHREAFLALVRWNARLTRETEAGCVSFDIVIAEDDPNRIGLVEIYRDQAARDYHAALPRLREIRKTYASMIERRTALIGSVDPH